MLTRDGKCEMGPVVCYGVVEASCIDVAEYWVVRLLWCVAKDLGSRCGFDVIS